MGQVKFKIKPGAEVEKCPKCGNATDFVAKSMQVCEENMGAHRWYDKMFVVVELEGMLIGYDDFHTTGDSNAYDLGLEHDFNSVCQVVKKQKTIDYYEKV